MLKIWAFAALVMLPAFLRDGGSAVRTHTIRLNGDAGKGEYRFSPARITARSGDTLLFVVESGGPHALGVAPDGLSEVQKEAWTRALPRRTGALRSPLLRAGTPYRVIIPAGIGAGKYLIFCLAHRAYDMRLEVEIK